VYRYRSTFSARKRTPPAAALHPHMDFHALALEREARGAA
jgi:hypothetical protein